jgi:cupin fold WbuC family metalloprotein
MKIFSAEYLHDLSSQAKSNPRQRQHCNIHESYQAACQRLFNAIEPGSYIRPHRHSSDPRDELLVAVRGLMALVTFDGQGQITNVIRFGTEKFGGNVTCAVEVPPSVWHTVVALEPGSVLLEIKAGPFDPGQPKDLAGWAPREDDPAAKRYCENILMDIQQKYPEFVAAASLVAAAHSSQ